MNTEILASIITSAVALCASALSGLISYKALQVQRKLSNSPLQIEYLNRKVLILEDVKKDLIEIDHKTYAKGHITKEQLQELTVESSAEMLDVLGKCASKLKGYFLTNDLTIIEQKVLKIRRYITFTNVEKLMPEAKPDEDFTEITQEYPMSLIYKIKEDLKKLIVDEIVNCNTIIEKIIKINVT